jgi:ABC-type multidrug transport system fused ATPase/permease subunit
LIDSIVKFVQNGNSSQVWYILIVYIIIRLVPDLISTVYDYIDKYWFIKFNNFIEIFTLKKRGEVDIAHVENPEFQDLSLRAFNNGVYPITQIIEISFDNTRRLFLFVVSAGAILLIDWRIFTITILTAIPSFIIELTYGGSMWMIWGENSREQRQFSEFRKYFVQKFPIIEAKLFQLHPTFLAKSAQILLNFFNKQIKLEKKRTWLILSAGILSAAGLYFSLFLSINSSMSGLITIGTVVFLFSSLGSLKDAATSLLTMIARQLERNLYVSDMYDIFNTKPIIKHKENPTKISIKVVPTIEFEDVSFKYPGTSEFILKNVSFKINPGEKIAFIGHNGAGKTTLTRLLLRIHDPSKGKILINGINLKDLDLNKWWGMLGVLPQDFTTFYFPVKEAIAFGDTRIGINDERVKKAAEQSTANTYIEQWKDKYDTMLGVEYGGEELSKGERQKMALARVFYRESKVLILDEPTAAVDAPSASQIFRNIEQIDSSKSILLISHNFATLRRADKIILLDNKTIAEMGTHDELMLKSQIYAKLYNDQKNEYE